jgi:hypothetical protein
MKDATAGTPAHEDEGIPPSLRDLVIRIANAPTGANHAALYAALPKATVFVKLLGLKNPPPPGERFLVPPGGNVQMRNARLPNGMQMVLASAASPRSVAADEIVGTMTGLELLQMVMKTPAEGVLIVAEDERDSWTAIKRESFAAILGRASSSGGGTSSA